MKTIKIKTTIACLVLSLAGLQSFAQLTIEQCYEKARANYPSILQYDLIEKSAQYNLSNANSGYLPHISFSAKASYQSEVTQIPISLPGYEGLKKDQYNVSLDVNQSIWDGGSIHAKKDGIRTASEVETKNLNVELYSLNDRVNQIYFAILLFDAQQEQNNLYIAELQRNYDKIASSVKNGVAGKTDLDAVRVEQLKAIQTKSKLEHSKNAYLAMLSALIGEKLSIDIALDSPAQTFDLDTVIHRPELELFAAQKRNYEAQQKQITSEMMPKFSAYLNGGYGRPGLNMLQSDFSPYYTVGVRMSWNISSFYNTKNSRKLILNKINTVEVQKRTFLFNSDIDVATKSSEIQKYRDQLQYDDQIIDLRGVVKSASESKMSNGTISGIDLMRDVTAEELAKQDKIYHQIELLQAIYNLKYATNNF